MAEVSQGTGGDLLVAQRGESQGGKVLAYTFDDAGNDTAIAYRRATTLREPSIRWTGSRGVGIGSSGALANFGFRGPDLQFDSARRTIADNVTSANLGGVLGQTVAWTPSSLLTGFQRSDTVGLMRKTRHKGEDRVGWMFTLTAAAHNLVRMRNLLEARCGVAPVSWTPHDWGERSPRCHRDTERRTPQSFAARRSIIPVPQLQ